MDRIEARLWTAFAVLFCVVAVAAVLPTEPLLAGLLPVWAGVVLVALCAAAVAAGLAARAGWPRADGGSGADDPDTANPPAAGGGGGGEPR